MPSLLIVEDEPAMLLGLTDVLKARGHEVATATRGDEGLALAQSEAWDLIILDVMLPGLSGFEVLKALRGAGDRTPVIMLTARNTELDKVLGFELGVDDYVTKPFSVMELLGRIQAVLRRSEPAPASPASATRRIGAAEVDFKAYTLHRDGVAIPLPARALGILGLLAARPGEVISRDAVIDAVWGADEYINERTVNNLVVKLRQAIEADPERPRHLKTIHGVGYRLDP